MLPTIFNTTGIWHRILLNRFPPLGKFLFITMVLCIVCAQSADSNGSCFGTVRPKKLYHKVSGGYLLVKNSRLITGHHNRSETFYMIMVKNKFLLYHPESNKFICWTGGPNGRFEPKERLRPSTKHCLFQEEISSDFQTYIKLKEQGGDHELQLSKRGKQFMSMKKLLQCQKKREKIRHHQHARKCAFPEFLKKEGNVNCNEAREIFCTNTKSELRRLCSRKHYNSDFEGLCKQC